MTVEYFCALVDCVQNYHTNETADSVAEADTEQIERQRIALEMAEDLTSEKLVLISGDGEEQTG